MFCTLATLAVGLSQRLYEVDCAQSARDTELRSSSSFAHQGSLEQGISATKNDDINKLADQLDSSLAF